MRSSKIESNSCNSCIKRLTKQTFRSLKSSTSTHTHSQSPVGLDTKAAQLSTIVPCMVSENAFLCRLPGGQKY